jgi:soluble lytic murein transglycosylase-like protein
MRADENNVGRLVVLMLFVAAVYGAGAADDNAERIRAAMQASLDAQRAAVRLQQVAARGTVRQDTSSDSFFTVPWRDGASALAGPATATDITEPVPTRVASWDCAPMAEPALATLINDAAERESLKPSIVRAVIETESAAYPCVVSPKGARGLMQLMPSTAASLSVENAFDAKQNVDAGTKFLKSLLDRYSDDLALALGAYNAGPARVDRQGSVPDIPETRRYVERILSRVKALDTQ